jgi:hypothetical protein
MSVSVDFTHRTAPVLTSEDFAAANDIERERARQVAKQQHRKLLDKLTDAEADFQHDESASANDIADATMFADWLTAMSLATAQKFLRERLLREGPAPDVKDLAQSILTGIIESGLDDHLNRAGAHLLTAAAELELERIA